MNDKVVQLTKQGYEELKKELTDIKTNKLPKAVERVARAREFGDLSENSEYHSAREDHAWIQGRLEELEALLSRVKIISNGGNKNQVNIGNTVKVKVNGSQLEFAIVGEWEADPATQKISHQSPLGQALVGKKIGDKVEVQAPAGKVTYTIEAIQ